MAGLLLIDPAFEMLFDAMESDSGSSGDDRDPEGDAPQPLTWHEYWYERIIPSAQGMRLSAVIGFNRLSLMVGLTSSVEKPELAKLLPKEVIQRKVSFTYTVVYTSKDPLPSADLATEISDMPTKACAVYDL